MDNFYNREHIQRARSKIIGIVGIILILVCSSIYFFFLSAPQWQSDITPFVVAIGATQDQVNTTLQSEGFIKNISAFNMLVKLRGIKNIDSGSYKISKSMNVWQIASVLSGKAALEWVVIPEGLRKEEIADILAKNLGWTNAQKTEWITVDTDPDADHFEGVYFPETYLIPTNETPSATATRLRSKFEEEFAPYATQALQQDIKWTTVLKIASIIQREAAGKDDMPLVSGIIWNRLNANMRLQVDSTVQYVRGNTGKGWWAPITPADEKIDSPYNTYTHAGLPPTPIDNPGIEAISAALNPASTKCIYYIHDNSGNIHCSVTYAEQQANIAKYLQ
jgi:UPF0755 protein